MITKIIIFIRKLAGLCIYCGHPLKAWSWKKHFCDNPYCEYEGKDQ